MTKHKQLIALSAGGANDELATHGVGIEHIEELMVRMTMRLLRDGYRLAFGGTLGIPHQKLTEALIHATQALQSETLAESSDINSPSTWPLVNYSAWPYFNNIDSAARANLVGICDFVDIQPPNVPEAELKQLNQLDREKSDGARSTPAVRLNAARALTAMRSKSSKEADLRVVWGGKIRGSSGWLPGILEEVGFSLLEKKPVLILGGFGGCAAVMAEYLKDIDAPWPEELTAQSCADAERDGLATEAEQQQRSKRTADMQAAFNEFRNQLHCGKDLYGIPAGQLFEALSTESSRHVIEIARRMAGNS